MNPFSSPRRGDDANVFGDLLGVDVGSAPRPASNAPRPPRPASNAPRPPRPATQAERRFEERRDWASTTLAALAISALVGAAHSLAGAFWDAWLPNVRAAFLSVVIATLYCGGFVAERRDSLLLSRFLYWLSTATFVGGVFALFVGGEDAAASPSAFWANALPPASLLVFATAQTSRSRVLHFLAAATFVVAFALADDSRRVLAFRFEDWALVCCALGEYWAWRRASPCVATIYFGFCLWTIGEILYIRPLPTGAHALILVCAVGFFQRWFGASFRSPFGATFGTFLAFIALGLTAFPYFWNVTFDATPNPPVWFAPEFAAILEASLAASLFVIFAVRLIFDGARQNIVQFAFAILLFTLWLIAQCVVAAVDFKEDATAIAPPATAAIVFAALFAKNQAALFAARRVDANGSASTEPNPEPVPNSVVVSDALNDDGDLDDLFDAEARAGADIPRLSPISDSLDEFWEGAAQLLRRPTNVASVLAQIAALFVFANGSPLP